MFGKDTKKKELIKNLGNLYVQIQKEHQISAGDFPDIKDMQEKLLNYDFTKFHPLQKRLLDNVDKMLGVDIAKVMAMIPQEQTDHKHEAVVRGGHFERCVTNLQWNNTRKYRETKSIKRELLKSTKT